MRCHIRGIRHITGDKKNMILPSVARSVCVGISCFAPSQLNSRVVPFRCLHRLHSAQAGVPPDFGGPNGPCITNKATVLQDVDTALGTSRPPDLEVLLTDHLCFTGNSVSKALHMHVLRFGHVAVRYTTKDGTQRVMNILGGPALALPDARMVNFVAPQEYLYGTGGFATYAQQGGVYNRDVVGVRIERVSEGAIEALHAYCEALDKRSEILIVPPAPSPASSSSSTSSSADPESSLNREETVDRRARQPQPESQALASTSVRVGNRAAKKESAKVNAKEEASTAGADETAGKAASTHASAAAPVSSGVAGKLQSPRQGPGGLGRGGARFSLTDAATLPGISARLGIPGFIELARSVSRSASKIAASAAERAAVAVNGNGQGAGAASTSMKEEGEEDKLGSQEETRECGARREEEEEEEEEEGRASYSNTLELEASFPSPTPTPTTTSESVTSILDGGAGDAEKEGGGFGGDKECEAKSRPRVRWSKVGDMGGSGDEANRRHRRSRQQQQEEEEEEEGQEKKSAVGGLSVSEWQAKSSKLVAKQLAKSAQLTANLLDTGVEVLEARSVALDRVALAGRQRVVKVATDLMRQSTFVSGNCAQWSSSALVWAGLLRFPRLFPKSILVELLESESLHHDRGSNVHVVVYSHVAHAKQAFDDYRFLKPAYVHPLQWVKNGVYSDMRKFANVVVEVPPGTIKARVVVNPSPESPPAWLPLWQAAVVGVPTAVMVGAVEHVGPIGPAAATAWLAVNWWLH